MRIRWRGLELPTRVVRDETVSTEVFGRFIVEPFERGFGTTVGNSLRRILLSSLEGAAITEVRIEGAEHEFTSLKGVYEDVAEIILNIKSLVVKSTSSDAKTMKVSVQGKAGQTVNVTAADIEADAHLEIINADHHLCTLTEDVKFEMVMTVNRGRSYITADENKRDDEEREVGVIAVDSLFSPVTRVRYRVEDTRVGQRTNYDRLVLDIWTNGTLTPEMSLVEAAKILRKHLNPFVQYFDLGNAMAAQADEQAQETERSSVDDELMATPVSALKLSVRSSNCLASANITTIGQLMEHDEEGLLKLRSFGKTSLREVKRKLAELGLHLESSGEDDGLDDDDDDDDDTGDFSPQAEEAASPPSASVPFSGSTSRLSGIAPLDSGSMGQSNPPAEQGGDADNQVEATSDHQG